MGRWAGWLAGLTVSLTGAGAAWGMPVPLAQELLGARHHLELLPITSRAERAALRFEARQSVSAANLGERRAIYRLGIPYDDAPPLPQLPLLWSAGSIILGAAPVMWLREDPTDFVEVGGARFVNYQSVAGLCVWPLRDSSARLGLGGFMSMPKPYQTERHVLAAVSWSFFFG